MTKPTGVLSPWGLHKPKEQSVEERILDNARPGSTLVSVRGQRYTILIKVQATFKDAKDTQDAASHILGEFLSEQKARLTPFLHTQKMAFDEKDLKAAATSLEFGNSCVWAVASSTDEGLAKKMAVDRLAMAFTWYRTRDPANKAALSKYNLEVVLET